MCQRWMHYAGMNGILVRRATCTLYLSGKEVLTHDIVKNIYCGKEHDKAIFCQNSNL